MDRQQAEPDPPQNQGEPFIKIEQISMDEVLNMTRPKQEPVYSPQSAPNVNIEPRAGAELEALPGPSGLSASNPSKQLYSTFQVQRPVVSPVLISILAFSNYYCSSTMTIKKSVSPNVRLPSRMGSLSCTDAIRSWGNTWTSSLSARNGKRSSVSETPSTFDTLCSN